MKQYGSDAARKFIDDATRVALYVISRHGFSVDLSNYTLSKEAFEDLRRVKEDSEKNAGKLIMQYRKGTLEKMPGRTLRETLEEKVMAELGKARDSGGEIVEKSLGTSNTSILMARIGARGSILNAIQMAGLVGQQAVRSKRLSRGYRGRVLLHFRKGDRGALSRGFVESSFVEGLTPKEFFFHSMGGRESLVNTAIRTARSGYMQRRLINALQDLVAYDGTDVRDSRGVIVQFLYGGDGLDTQKAVRGGEVAETSERE